MGARRNEAQVHRIRSISTQTQAFPEACQRCGGRENGQPLILACVQLRTQIKFNGRNHFGRQFRFIGTACLIDDGIRQRVRSFSCRRRIEEPRFHASTSPSTVIRSSRGQFHSPLIGANRPFRLHGNFRKCLNFPLQRCQ